MFIINQILIKQIKVIKWKYYIYLKRFNNETKDLKQIQNYVIV